MIIAGKKAEHGAGAIDGTVQQTSVGTGGVALNLSAWAGRRIAIYATAACRYRWSQSSTPTTIDATTNSTNASSPVATGGGRIYSDKPTVRDVPFLPSGEEVYLIVASVSGTADVVVEVLR